MQTATAVGGIATDQAAVCRFLQRLFPAAVAVDDSVAGATAGAAAAAATAPEGAAAAAALEELTLHPQVDATHPLGEAHSARELQDALRLFRQLVSSMALEVDDVLLGPDKALATGHLVVTSLVGPLVTAGAGAVGSATHRLLPQPLEKLAASASHLLPAGLAAARVPITIHMRLGKSDAGAPVVTHMSLVFSLLSVLLPHVRLQPWQAQALAAAAPQARGLLLQAGAAAAVAGDVGTSVGASWRAATAMLQATLGQVLGVAKEQAQHMWSHSSATAAPAGEGVAMAAAVGGAPRA